MVRNSSERESSTLMRETPTTARPVSSRMRELKELAMNGLIPVTHGDVLHHSNRKYYILSGDVLMRMLAKELKPDVVVFALNVDGVYSDLRSRKLVREIKALNHAKLSSVPVDVTGGMNRKLGEAFKMSRMGVDVMMVNGLKPERIVDALNGKNVEGTLVRGVK